MGLALKFGLIVIFAAFLYWLIDYIMGKFGAMIDINTLAPNIKYFLCRLGVFQAFNIFASLYIASWFTNKLIEWVSGG